MNTVQKHIIKYGMDGILRFLAFFARRPSLSGVTKMLTSGLAKLTIKNKQIQAVGSLKELGQAWQQSFASKKLIPITGMDEHTVYAEIRIKCPLRGSGDTLACHRMMNFDRQILEQAGGQFMVLESQAVPGIHHCKVAMRLKDRPTDDLVQAHEK